MTKIFTAALLAGSLFISGVASAKSHAYDNLNLTDEQKVEAKQIFEQGKKKVKALREEQKAIKEKIKKQEQENREAFEQILTPEQKELYRKTEADKAEQKAQKRKMRGMHDVKKECPCLDDEAKTELKKRPMKKPIPHPEKGGFVEE